MSEIRLAFSHPAERAAATGRPPDMLDRISLRDHVVEVEIGAFQAERGTTQRVAFNVVVEVAPRPAGLDDDDVDHILSYDCITEAIAAELAVERVNLLETLAERIAARILTAPQAMRCFVRIEKLDRGPGALGVEIVRARGRSIAPSALRADPVEVHPEIFWLSNAAIHDPALPAWLDRIEAERRAAILCVGLPDTPRPQAAAPLAQRRIDLLAIEQNAWVLAGRDPRCVVVASRTELDWGMKHGQISVWAPSKLVLDAVDGPSRPDCEPRALALWLSQLLQADRCVLIGASLPRRRAAVQAVAVPDLDSAL